MSNNLEFKNLKLGSIDFTQFDLETLYQRLPDEIKFHSLRVAVYGSIIYRHMVNAGTYKGNSDIKKGYAKYIKDAFRYHDIGKVVPILYEEYAKDKTEAFKKEIEEHIEDNHPIYAMSIFKELMESYKEYTIDKKAITYIAQESAISHHEMWNGKGYPEKRIGTEINVFARICAVANTYDHLSYDEKLTFQESLKELNDNKMKAFDPNVIDALKECSKEIVEVSNFFTIDLINANKLSDIYSDKNINNILLGKTGRIRNALKYSADLFMDDDLRPIEMLYNKIVDTDDHSVLFVDTNVVLNHPSEGTLFPSNYEVVAWESERCEQLNKWAITEIGTIHPVWEDRFHEDIKFLVTLSAKTLCNSEAVLNLIKYLNLLGLDKEKIAFELSVEELIKYSPSDINKNIEVLRTSLEVDFVLNGLNADYSSYDSIIEYDFNYLKVDYGMYKRFDNRGKVEAIITKLFDLCRSLGIELIFTNVNNEEEITKINEYGIHYMEGTAFGSLQRKPGPAFFKLGAD